MPAGEFHGFVDGGMHGDSVEPTELINAECQNNAQARAKAFPSAAVMICSEVFAGDAMTHDAEGKFGGEGGIGCREWMLALQLIEQIVGSTLAVITFSENICGAKAR